VRVGPRGSQSVVDIGCPRAGLVHHGAPLRQHRLPQRGGEVGLVLPAQLLMHHVGHFRGQIVAYRPQSADDVTTLANVSSGKKSYG
jgi:hypothetical protein